MPAEAGIAKGLISPLKAATSRPLAIPTSAKRVSLRLETEYQVKALDPDFEPGVAITQPHFAPSGYAGGRFVAAFLGTDEAPGIP